MFYTDISSSVILYTSTTKRFNINRGVRQFPLFYFCWWLNYYQSVLLIMMKSKVFNFLIMYLRYPNWQMTLLYLKKNVSFIPRAISFINNCSRASALTLNVYKCEILPLHTINDKYIMNIPIKSSLEYKYLLLERQNLHFSSRLKKTEAVLNCWLQRDLSIYGRALLSKADGLSRFVYHYMLKILTARILIICSSLLFGKTNPKDLKRVLTNKKAEGGLEMLYFEDVNKTFKINWLIN